MKIRVAQRGWVDSVPAETVDEVRFGIGCSWVEIDGVRIEPVMAVEYRAADDEFSIPRLIIDAGAGIDIVYVDDNGDPLPGPLMSDSLLPSGVPIDHQTVLSRAEVEDA